MGQHGCQAITETPQRDSQPPISSTVTLNSNPNTMNSFLKIFFALFLCVSVVSALPKGMGYMEIYKECKARYGTKPQIECRSSSDCMLKTKNTKCPEHDCIKERSGERKGKSFCTWVVF